MPAPQPRRRAQTSDIDRTAPASVIIDKFGGLMRFCDLNGIPTSTAFGWQKSGLIPSRRQEAILTRAREHKVAIKPADFVPTPRSA